MSDIYIVLLSLVILLILVILTSFILKKLVIDVNAEAKKKYLLNVSRYEEETMDVPLKNNEQAKIINPFPSVSDPDNDNKNEFENKPLNITPTSNTLNIPIEKYSFLP